MCPWPPSTLLLRPNVHIRLGVSSDDAFCRPLTVLQRLHLQQSIYLQEEWGLFIHHRRVHQEAMGLADYVHRGRYIPLIDTRGQGLTSTAGRLLNKGIGVRELYFQ